MGLLLLCDGLDLRVARAGQRVVADSVPGVEARLRRHVDVDRRRLALAAQPVETVARVAEHGVRVAGVVRQHQLECVRLQREGKGSGTLTWRQCD